MESEVMRPQGKAKKVKGHPRGYWRNFMAARLSGKKTILESSYARRTEGGGSMSSLGVY